MNKLSIIEARRYASFALHIWGEQLRARRVGVPYVGNIDSGTYKPRDDPHAHAFLVCTVETVLKELGYFHYHLALHFYGERRWLDQYRDAKLEVELPSEFLRTGYLRKMQNEIVAALGTAFMERHSETIVSATMQEVRERLAAERRRMQKSKRGTDSLRPSPQEVAKTE